MYGLVREQGGKSLICGAETNQAVMMDESRYLKCSRPETLQGNRLSRQVTRGRDGLPCAVSPRHFAEATAVSLAAQSAVGICRVKSGSRDAVEGA